jgi:hypothetical protein
MGKKVIGILVVGLLMATVFPVASMYIGETEKKVNIDFESKLLGIGLIRIDSAIYEIKGLVLFGMNDGQVLVLKKIDIKCDGPPLFVGGLPPFIINIKYNPA